jgi:hypothetical protein
MKNKILGLILLLVGIIEMKLLPEDATAGFMCCLMALCLIFSKNVIQERQ